MKCRLCLEEKKLLKKSHIIPEFMYQELFDEKHKLYKYSFKKKKVISRPSTGVYDSDILCLECDKDRLGNELEDYASKVMYTGNLSDDKKIIVTTYKDGKYTYSHIENLDYKKFKLFLLSILWRASISKQDYFSRVDLGPYEELIRIMILNNDPKTKIEFGCMIHTLRNDLEWANQIHVEPVRTKYKQGSTYRFIISGSLYLYFVPKYFWEENKGDFLLSENNEIKIAHAPKGKGEELIKNFLGITRLNEVGIN